MGKAIRITVEGEWSEVDMPEPGKTLHWLYEQIGCHTVDVVRLKRGLDMWVDDEGSFVNDGENVNYLATAFNQVAGNLHPALWGTAVITRTNEMGDTIALADEDVANFNAILRILKVQLVDLGFIEVPAAG